LSIRREDMIQINEFILNEKLIKAVVPYFEETTNNTYGYNRPPQVKVIFIDNSDMILTGVDIYQINNVLNPPLT
jgi:hypothetical protein